MYVCVCNAVTDREIKACVQQGVRDLRALSDLLGVATCCGQCAPLAEEVIHAWKAETEFASV
jgi:bacterioferritin-associated ferredoxin